jgi:hypothetical protein
MSKENKGKDVAEAAADLAEEISEEQLESFSGGIVSWVPRRNSKDPQPLVDVKALQGHVNPSGSMPKNDSKILHGIIPGPSPTVSNSNQRIYFNL